MSIWEKEAPSGGKDYLTLKNGESARIRMFGQPIDFMESFQNQEPTTKFATLCIYRNKAERVNEVKGFKFGWTVQKAIKALYKDDDWGDPTEYDIEVTRIGEGMDTKYTVVPKPKAALNEDEKALIAGCELDLIDMFINKKKQNGSGHAPTGGDYDPFADE